MWAIIKKEVKSYFLSPIGYVFIGIFLLAFSISFNLELVYSYGNVDFQNIFAYIFTYLPTILVFSFLIPMLTMRSFSEERKNGTETLLLTSPVSTTKIVLAKFIAALAIELIALLFTMMFIIIICIFGTPDMSTVLVTLLGFILLCMAYTAFGIFASSITENQIIAAMITIITFIVTWVLPEFLTTASNFSLINMFYKYTTGQIDIAYTITFIALTALCLALTIVILQKRKSKFIKRTTTAIIIAVLIVAFIGLTIGMNSLNLDPIDFTQNRLYTLTDTSKEQLKQIDTDINIYFIGYTENATIIDLAKQYHNVSDKINVEVVDISNRPDLAQKYGIEAGAAGVIVEGNNKAKILTATDFYTFDPVTYKQIDITEEKLTNAILYVISEKIPTAYFLEGFTDYSIDNDMRFLSIYLENEITEYKTVNTINTGKIPEDCDVLIITKANADFDDITTNAIINYINNGGNILWIDDVITENTQYANVNKILALYGIKPFDVGFVNETDSNKMMYTSSSIIVPEVQYNTITRNIVAPIFFGTTKINFVSDKELEDLNVTKTVLLQASSTSYFKTDFDTNKTNNDEYEQGPFVVGAELVKKISEDKTSKLIIYSDNDFISDYTASSSSNTPFIAYPDNHNTAVDSIAYLADRQVDIIIRKDTNTTTYTATEQQNNIIQTVIFAIPVAIIFAGVLVWQHRRRKK